MYCRVTAKTRVSSSFSTIRPIRSLWVRVLLIIQLVSWKLLRQVVLLIFSASNSRPASELRLVGRSLTPHKVEYSRPRPDGVTSLMANRGQKL